MNCSDTVKQPEKDLIPHKQQNKVKCYVWTALLQQYCFSLNAPSGFSQPVAKLWKVCGRLAGSHGSLHDPQVVQMVSSEQQVQLAFGMYSIHTPSYEMCTA